MAGLYTHTTFQSLVDQLAQELNDTGKVFFTEPELILSLYEAFRFWNSVTGYHRELTSFNTRANEPFYYLPTELPTQLSRTVTVNDILGTIQYHLMEPYSPVTSTGISKQFTHVRMVQAIQQRHNRFLAETSRGLDRLNPIFVSPGSGVVQLDDDVISIERAVWRTLDTPPRYFNLIHPTDEGMATSHVPAWRQSPSRPSTYSTSLQPNLTLQLIPPPSDQGELMLMVQRTGPDLDTTTLPSGTVLSIADDSSWAITWGALIDLLLHPDSLTRDPARAAYCHTMYETGVELATTLPTVLGVTINDIMVAPGSLKLLDTMRSGWEGRSPDQPSTVALMGDWLVLSPPPDTAYSIGVHLVRKAPLPALTDSIQYGREVLVGLTGWAKQLLLFKKQGVQLQQGIQSASLLIEQARVYNEERIRHSTYLCELFGLSTGTMPSLWTPPRAESGQGQGQGGLTEAQDTADSALPRSYRPPGGSSARGRTVKRLGGR